MQEPDAFFCRACGCGDRKQRSNRGTDEIRIVKVSKGIADDDSIGFGGVGRSQNGPKITGLFYTFKNDNEWIVIEL